MPDPTESSSSSRRQIVGSIQEKAQEILREDLGHARVLASEAVRSQAYLYPIKGILYFATHRSLWKPLLSKLAPYMTLSLSVTTFMLLFTYVPQLAVLVLVNGPFAVFSTVLLILNESATITNVISRSWILQEALLDTFDGTLVARNATEIVQEGRQLKAGADPMEKLGKVLKSPFDGFSPKALVRYVLYLPLNFVPVVGTVLFLIIQGRSRGQAVHGRYFQLKRWSTSQKSDWLGRHSGPYAAFGVVATLLEMVPFMSIVFSFTNTVGAALWAADIEGRGVSDGTEAPAQIFEE